MRWWLPLAFTLIAAGTAAGVGFLLDQGAQDAFRSRAHAVAVGDAVAAATAAQRPGAGPAELNAISSKHDLSLFIVGYDGRLHSGATSLGVSYSDVPRARRALAAVGNRRRYVRGTPAGGTVVGLRLPALKSVLVAYRPRSGVAGEVRVVRGAVITAAILAGAGGALVGVLIASLVTRRVRRISTTAAAIEGGDFSKPVDAGFGDEIGALGSSVERMRGHLAESFASLEYEHDRLKQILERLHDGVIAVDGGGHIEFANPTARRLAPTARLAPGAPIGEPWPGLDMAGVLRRLRSGEAVEHRFHDGERTIDLVGLPPSASRGTVVLVVTDVSEKERRERAEREFVANAAHELRTPTAAILSSVEILQAGAKDDPIAREQFLDHIGRESARLARLSRAMLVLARAQTGAEPLALHPVALEPLLREGDQRRGASTASRVRIECPADLRVGSPTPTSPTSCSRT